MYWLVIIMDYKENLEKYKFTTKEKAEGVYYNHVTMFNDKYVVLLECNGKAVNQLAVYYNKMGV